MQASKYASSIVSLYPLFHQTPLFSSSPSHPSSVSIESTFGSTLDDFRPIKFGIMENGEWSREWKRSSCGGNGCWILGNWNSPFAKLVLFNVAEYGFFPLRSLSCLAYFSPPSLCFLYTRFLSLYSGAEGFGPLLRIPWNFAVGKIPIYKTVY